MCLEGLSNVFHAVEGGVALKQEDQGYDVHNRMEEVAVLVVKKVVEEDKSACTCPRCQLDMEALVLNVLPPDYVVLENGAPVGKSLITSLDILERELFHHALAGAYRALDIVKSAPRHGDDVEISLRNYTEDMIVPTLQEILKHRKTECTCSECLSRVMMYALNDLKPKYTTTAKGDVYARVDEIDARHLAKVYAALYGAFEHVEKDGCHL
jgi:competence protein ComFB